MEAASGEFYKEFSANDLSEPLAEAMRQRREGEGAPVPLVGAEFRLGSFKLSLVDDLHSREPREREN